jgi:hypothetical protein
MESGLRKIPLPLSPSPAHLRIEPRNLDNAQSLREQNTCLSPDTESYDRPLSFQGSIWIRSAQNMALQLDNMGETTQPIDLCETRLNEFSKNEKRRLVYLVSLAAIFSPLSSNIYFPAMNSIAEVQLHRFLDVLTNKNIQDLHTTTELISLTITIYMLMQGLAPSLWGPLADSYGRRPILILTLIVYILANLGLGLSKSFATLMTFRGFQAIGSASTIAIGILYRI